jgi:hypothetical protein
VVSGHFGDANSEILYLLSREKIQSVSNYLSFKKKIIRSRRVKLLLSTRPAAAG